MFILLRGAADVGSKNGSAIPVATLRSGDCFGEMSLLTGEKRTRRCALMAIATSWKLGKEVMRMVFQDRRMFPV